MPSSLIQIAPSGRYFQFADGTPFMPIGHNTHADFLEVFGYHGCLLADHVLEERFARLAEAGGNYMRLFISNRLEDGYFQTGQWHEPTVRRIDRLFELAERYDIYFCVEMFVSQYFSQWYRVDQWPYSPFNAANGGPVPTRPGAEHILDGTNPEGRWIRHDMEYRLDNEPYVAAQKAKIQWFVERFGGNPRVFNWGLSNDFPWSGTESDPALIQERRHLLEPWLETMAGWLRGLDKHGHLVSLQLGSGAVWPEWMRRHLDFTSIRAYPWSTPEVYDDAIAYIHQPNRHAVSLALHLARKAAEHWPYGSPTVCGEYGACSFRDPETKLFSLFPNVEACQRATLYGLWVPLATGAIPGHRWTGHDGFYPLMPAEYGYLRAINEFCGQIDWSTYDPRPHTDELTVDDADAALWSLGDDAQVIGFVLCTNRDRDGSLRLTLSSRLSGPWTIRFLDPRTAQPVGNPATLSPDAAIPVPAFDDCIAFTARKG